MRYPPLRYWSLASVRPKIASDACGHRTPKSDAGTRDVAIPHHLIPMIQEHLTHHTQPGRDGLLFPAANGGHLAPSTLYKSFYRARQTAGRPDLRWHDLRHSAPGAALRYQHAAQGRDLEIAKALSALATPHAATN